MIIRIVSKDIPLETLKAALLKSHVGLEEKPRLTAIIEDCYYAVVAPGAAAIVIAMLDSMYVTYTEVDSLPRKPQQPTFVTSRIASLLNSGNRDVSAAAGRYVAAVLDDLTANISGSTARK